MTHHSIHRQTHRADFGPGPGARADAPVSSHHRRESREKSCARVMALAGDRSCARCWSRFEANSETGIEQWTSSSASVSKQVQLSSRRERATCPSERQTLIGAYFTHEYSPESAALFNPSIVPHPDQIGVARGALRFILSLRATGEGHISSITFRDGIVSAQHRITLTLPVHILRRNRSACPMPLTTRRFLHENFRSLGVQNDFCQRVLDQLREHVHDGGICSQVA